MNHKKCRKCTVALILLLCLIFSACGSTDKDWRSLYEKTGTSLAAGSAPTVGSIGGEWVVIGLSRSDRLSDDFSKKYLNAASEHVKNIGKNRLHDVKSTENSRLILGITAAGGNPTDIGGCNLIQGLTDTDYIKRQGNNGPIWALIALDCGNYAIPFESDVTREGLIEIILSMQCSDGGWGFSGNTSDTDMTAMALQALAPYIVKSNVKSAAKKALQYLSDNQTDNGGYESYSTQNCESCAQVTVALCSLGIDPQTDERFIKCGNSVLDALCAFSVDDGFCHQANKPQANQMATEQAYYALTAYHRLKSGKSALYTMYK